MKKILLCIMGLSLFASPSFGDEVESVLTQMASEQIRENTRQMIRAGMAEDEAVKMTRMMIQNRFQEENTVKAQQIIIDALSRNLPPEPIVNKAYEGMAKKASDQNIVQAMETTLSRYAYAYKNAGQITGQNAWQRQIGNTIAEGLTAGMTEADVNGIREMLRQGDQVGDGDPIRDRDRDQDQDGTHLADLALQSFLGARDMTRLGVNSRDAAELINQALQSRHSAREMAQLRQAFNDLALHQDPGQLANRFTAAASLYGTTCVSLITESGTPALPAIPSVAAPEPAATSSESTCPW